MPDGQALKPETIMRMATTYLARHSASVDHVREVLVRKILRRLDRGEERPDEVALRAMIDPVLDRLVRTGLLDDAAFARGKAASLAAKGRPGWRIKADRARDGVTLDGGEAAATVEALDPVVQATIWARRRRLGPFRLRDRALHRERDIASLARAGFSVQVARQVVDQDREAEE